MSESESVSENDHDEDYYIIKQLNNYFKTNDETKSFKQQIETLKTKDFLMNCGISDVSMAIKN